MSKEEVRQAYHMVRDAKLALDAMLGSAPAEVRQAYHDKYKRDVGAFFSVSDTGVPVSAWMRKRRKAKTTHASRGQYLAASAAIRTAMHVRKWGVS
jgi:hypothetical protein